MEPLSEAALTKDKGYSTSYQLNLGMLVRPLRSRPSLELMIGIGWDKSPVPDRSFALDSPSYDQIFGAVGFRERLGRSVRIGLGYSVTAFLQRDIRTSETSPPTNVRSSAIGHAPSLEVSY